MRAVCIYREERDGNHIEIWDEGEKRSLWFDDVILQSEIHRQDPAVLPNPVNRQMLAYLMFGLPFRRVLLAGCGGGAIARWIAARAPEVCGDALELSPTVARLAREYFDFPPPDSGWRLMVGDIREYLALRHTVYDFILVDLEEQQNTPDWVTSPEFLGQCRNHLAPTGGLTINMITGDNERISAALVRVRQAFDGDTLLLADPDHDNLLVSVFNQPPRSGPADDEHLRARGRHWGLDFVGMRQHLTRVAACPR